MKKLVEFSNRTVEIIIDVFGIDEEDAFSDIFLKVTVPLLIYAWILIIVIGSILVFTGFGFTYTFIEFLENVVTLSFVLILIAGIIIAFKKDIDE